jgi:enoyl-CoA hydratase
MPEAGIGFAPDVGGTFLYSRAPGRLGIHAALTAAQLSGADTIHCGLADHFVPSGRLPALLRALAESPPEEAVTSCARTPPESVLAGQAQWIDSCYAAGTVEEILDRLRGAGEAANSAAKEIAGKSPTALKVTLRALRSAAGLPTLEAVLDQEYRTSRAALHSHDLAEGIRAQIIDKDRNPRWSPATLAEVGPELVDSFFL